MAVQAISCEPVSAPISLLTGNLTGIFAETAGHRLPNPSISPHNQLLSSFCEVICAGNYFTHAGNFLCRAGNCRPGCREAICRPRELQRGRVVLTEVRASSGVCQAGARLLCPKFPVQVTYQGVLRGCSFAHHFCFSASNHLEFESS